MEVKTHFPRAGWFFLWFALGLGLGMTQLFAPIHEVAHATVANNNGVADTAVTGWDNMRMFPLNRKALLAGWTMQVILLSVGAAISAMIGRYPKCRWMTGGLWIGAAFTHWVRAFNSSDFIDRLREYYQAQFPNDPASALAYYNAYRAGLIDTWWKLGIWVFLITGLIIILCMAVKKKNSG